MRKLFDMCGSESVSDLCWWQDCLTPYGFHLAELGGDEMSDKKILKCATAGSTCVDVSQIGSLAQCLTGTT